jgi:acyl-CoA thioester hydrolase
LPRIKLSEQEAYEFRHVLQVRPQDVNHGGHVGNDHLISLVGAASALLFRSLGFSELNLGDGQTGTIMADLAVNYLAEAFMFDELLIETHFGELAEKGFRMFHRVTRNSMLIALVETGFVAYNYALKDTVPLPQYFLERLNKKSGDLNGPTVGRHQG